MRVVVIGGTGHVGTFLIPRLVRENHEVICISRGRRQPYQRDEAWQSVQQLKMDRAKEEETNLFGTRIRDMKPDVVIDMICFTLDSARHLVEALRGHVQHFLHCGTIWVHGHSVQVPTTESAPRRPFGDYGIQKAAIEEYLLNEARRNGFPATILHPGHISGPGWIPINPTGNLNLSVFHKLASGQEVVLPNLGMETLHHVHADDVAQAFIKSMVRWSSAVGESFHVVSSAAVTLLGYAEKVASWFGQEATLSFQPWEQWRTSASEQDAACTWDHIAHSPNCSIAKAQDMLEYQPRYTSLQAVREVLDWLVKSGQVKCGKPKTT
jgi:nucleoside-diphosphate-sugar epimerase